ncbi:TetR family transcriptional regulator [Rhodococcoides trifolii]|uniref:TetR family transcriptional regulator n=1 Tax=Rhodococcoides trifolii TaxID=908250 RepID=A0A917LDS9_9NOCA|nr:TetR/AcrR family transcriptional regulator [Rhodococcus trifolii]GGG14479.1 TetR family transcriptional regulator [Rhodococcus trifolii]
MKRTRLTPEQRRAQLIELGLEMLAERTLDQISVEDIADKAGVSRGLLFHYFATKHEFHLEIVRHNSREMLERTEPPAGLDAISTLRAAMTSYVDYVEAQRSTYVSLLRGTASGDPDMRAVFEETRSLMAQRTLSQLPRLGIERTAQIDLAVRGWIAFVEEVTITWLSDPHLTKQELIDLTVRALPAVALPPELSAALLSATTDISAGVVPVT